MLYDYSIWRKMGSRGRLTLQDGGGGGAPAPQNQNTSQTPNQNAGQTPNQHPLNNYMSHIQNALDAYDWSPPPNLSINQTPFPSNLVTQRLDSQINQGMIRHRLMSPNEMLATASATENTLRNLDGIAPFTPSESSRRDEVARQHGVHVSRIGESLQNQPAQQPDLEDPQDGRGKHWRIPLDQLGTVLDNPTHYSRIQDSELPPRAGHGYIPATQLGKDLKNPPTTQGPPPSN
jgi:hypothetical protein